MDSHGLVACPACAKHVSSLAIACVGCGHPIVGKDRGIACLLGLVFPGGGHLYVGDFASAAGVMLMLGILWALGWAFHVGFWIAAVAWWFLSAADAVARVDRRNRLTTKS